MHLDELTGRRVALLGLGSDVSAAIGAIAAASPADLVAVEDAAAGDGPGGSLARVSLAEAAATADVLVRSPGFPRYGTELVAARGRGARMTTPLDLWVGTHGPGRTVVAITGTKGKSTVTDLVGRLAGAAGLDVGVAGNLGVPVFDEGWARDAPIVVLEVSSYQAADLHHAPDLAVLTYLSEDHLSWHGGVERYVADKLRVLRNEGGTAGRILVPVEGGRAAAEIAVLDSSDPSAGLARVVEVVAPPETSAAVPRHRLQNAALAARVVTHLGGEPLADSAVVDAARASLPGRLDECDGPDGLLCLDDALASNPSAAAAGLAWLRASGHPTIVILGGSDRGVDPTPLVEEAARWEVGALRAVAVPENGVALARAAGIELLGESIDVRGAVEVGLRAAVDGGALIFGPAAPTPPSSGNWETRSAEFRAALSDHVRA